MHISAGLQLIMIKHRGRQFKYSRMRAVIVDQFCHQKGIIAAMIRKLVFVPAVQRSVD